MTTYLGKSCSFCLPRVPFVNCRQFMYLVISLLVLRAGYGIWLYQFLIIAYLFTSHGKNPTGIYGSPNSHGGKSPTSTYGPSELSWWEEFNSYLWVNQTLMVRRVQQASMGQPNTYGEKSPTSNYWSSELSWWEVSTSIYGSTELLLWEEFNRHLWVKQTPMVRRVQHAYMGQPNSHGEKSPTGIYGSTEISWCEKFNRHLWVSRTPVVTGV